MKTVFMGTGPFAASALRRLADSPYEVVLVVTQPDRPNSRRGSKIVFGEVKQLALERDIPLFQPDSVSSPDSQETLKQTGADIAVVCSYGQLLRKNILYDTFPLGCINIHASLLEKYRGAAPISRAVMAGEKEVGVTIMYMDEGLDTGDMMISASTPVTDEDTFGTVSERLSVMGGDLAVQALDLMKDGKAPRTAQDQSRASYAEKILKKDKHIDFSLSARDVFNFVRALDPSPAAEALLNGKTVKIFSIEPADPTGSGVPGKIERADRRGIIVRCGEGTVLIKTLKPEGKGLMDARSFYNGIRNTENIFS